MAESEKDRKNAEKAEKMAKLLQRAQKLPLSVQLDMQTALNKTGNLPLVSSSSEKVGEVAEFKQFLYGKVCFRTENYISHISEICEAAAENTPYERFDVITCFNTAMWVHLNFKDLGLQTLFLKVHLQLTTGGHFLLEINEWKEYKKKRNISLELKANSQELKLKPFHWR